MEHLQELKEEEADESPGVHNGVISAPSPTRGMNPDNFTHKTNEAASEADCSSYDEENIKQKHQVDNTVEEPDEYYKQQPDKIVEGKPDEYDKTLKRPAVKRSPDSLRVFTLDELMSATRNFSEENLLGEGGTIYKGTVNGKHTVAITKFTCAKWPVGCVIDKPALEYLGTMRHPHLVRLLGYCDQGEHNIPIHEYMPRGSLKYHLSLETDLITSVPWLTRLNIAVGAAKGLSFLHKSRKQMMFYTDFKASNILLASDYTAKLWGFGLSTQNDMTVSKRKTREVYNFGEVLLELLAGRPCIDEKRHDHERNLVEWFQLYVFREDDVSRKGIRLRHIMDPDLQWRYSVRASWSTAAIAHQCMDSVPEKRPSMHDVVEALEPLLNDDRNDGPTLANSGGA